MTLTQIFEPIREDLEAVEREFVRHIQSRVALIPEMGRYIQKSGGKRVRPAVLLMAARLSGYTGDRAVLYASVVEFIHTATLVHDDIIDDADLRRGRLAVHSRWGNDITVLLGDYLYIKSMAMALTQDSLEIIRLLCDVTLRMIEGELYQLTKTGDVDITEDEHFEIIRRKTAFLFGGCAQIGGMLGGVTPEQETALRDYGFNLGDRVPARRRSARLHRGRRGARKADRRRPARRQSHAADHPPAAPGEAKRPTRSIRDVVRDRAVTTEQWREILRLLREHRVDRTGLQPGARVRRARQGLPVGVPRRARARRAHGADRLRAVPRSLGLTGPDMRTFPIPPLTIEVVEGDISTRQIDAVVNAANNALWMGSGVAGAIKARGGDEIEKAAMAQGPIQPGEAVLTSGGRLPAGHVIHAAAMAQDLRTDARLIESATRSALRIAATERFQSLAFPALGTGVGGFPVADCARLMIGVLRDHAGGTSLRRVEFVLFGSRAYADFVAGVESALA